jgi:uncharacterized protein (DUF362 family)
VFVAEGQGNDRDSNYVLELSGLSRVLREENLEFVDLNYDDVYSVAMSNHISRLTELYLPVSLRRADIVVSMPKMKTHHWAGVTLSLKNMFGVMPGVYYGWPKNLLHWAGIPQTILDINANVRPQLAIIDGIVAMEGDGPLSGTPKALGVLIMGQNLTAVDATATRLMKIDPWSISYLATADGWLGNIDEMFIRQCGEEIDGLACRFEATPTTADQFSPRLN